MNGYSRRRALGVLAMSAVGGCVGRVLEQEDESVSTADKGEIPYRSQQRYIGWSLEEIEENTFISAGPDEIPSIDEPVFAGADETHLDDDQPVFGVEKDGDAYAYPQRILVFHEIVSHTIDGVPVAVTYCPLTGTTQGFERGSTAFGVSGRLVNNNLVMFDRATESHWPQMLATASTGPHQGHSLREFQIVWTTWKRWRQRYPDTDVLTEETGYVRRYGDDPYGGYAPRSGYYAEDANPMFFPLVENDAVPPKRVVIGTRTTEGAIAFEKDAVLNAGIKEGSIGETPYVAVRDESLETAYVYEGVTADSIEAVDGDNAYRVDGDTYAPETLPYRRRVAFDGFYFAWFGFYPEMTYVT